MEAAVDAALAAATLWRLPSEGGGMPPLKPIRIAREDEEPCEMLPYAGADPGDELPRLSFVDRYAATAQLDRYAATAQLDRY